MATNKRERLVNLVVALLETRRPLTLAELRARTGEYGQGDVESARRQFERDKDDLRTLGVPIETQELDLGAEIGYRIDRGAYELPDVQLTPEEVAALALAVQLTGDDRHRLALAKLAARAPDPAELTSHVGVRVDVGLDPVDDVLADALVRRTPLRFRYRTAAGDEAERHVDPYAVVQRRGSWYLVAHDHGRGERRAFRLDRIVEGVVRRAGEPDSFTPPDDLDVEAAVSGPDVGAVVVRLAVRGSARFDVELRGGRRVAVAEGTSADQSASTRADLDAATVYELGDLDPVRDRAWLLGLGAAVEVLAPDGLRDDLAAAHRRVATIHAGEGRP